MKMKKTQLTSLLMSMGLTTSVLVGCSSPNNNNNQNNNQNNNNIEDDDRNNGSSGGAYVPASGTNSAKSGAVRGGSTGIGGGKGSAVS